MSTQMSFLNTRRGIVIVPINGTTDDGKKTGIKKMSFYHGSSFGKDFVENVSYYMKMEYNSKYNPWDPGTWTLNEERKENVLWIFFYIMLKILQVGLSTLFNYIVCLACCDILDVTSGSWKHFQRSALSATIISWFQWWSSCGLDCFLYSDILMIHRRMSLYQSTNIKWKARVTTNSKFLALRLHMETFSWVLFPASVWLLIIGYANGFDSQSSVHTFTVPPFIKLIK